MRDVGDQEGLLAQMASDLAAVGGGVPLAANPLGSGRAANDSERQLA